MMALNFAAISAGATGVRSAASEAKAKAIPIACGALLCGAIAVPSQRLTQKGQSLPASRQSNRATTTTTDPLFPRPRVPLTGRSHRPIPAANALMA